MTLWQDNFWPAKFLTAKNIEDFLEIHHIFPVMFHIKFTRWYLSWLVKLLTGKYIYGRIFKNRQFNTVNHIPEKGNSL